MKREKIIEILNTYLLERVTDTWYGNVIEDYQFEDIADAATLVSGVLDDLKLDDIYGPMLNDIWIRLACIWLVEGR